MYVTDVTCMLSAWVMGQMVGGGGLIEEVMASFGVKTSTEQCTGEYMPFRSFMRHSFSHCGTFFNGYICLNDH